VGRLKYAVIRAAFEFLSLSQISHLSRLISPARGVIFTLHRVLPEPPRRFSPNAILQVTPDFLDFAIGRVRALGFDIVGMDEAVRRIASDEPVKRFAVFSFDDAYRDNLVHALPVLRRQKCPFTLYVPTALVDGVGEVWWQALEDLIAANNSLAVIHRGEVEYFVTASLAEKQAAYDALYARMRIMPEDERVELIRDLAQRYGMDLAAHCRSLIMDWSELGTFAREPLCTIGAHTVHHYELSKLSTTDARNEMSQSARIIKAQFGTEPRHFSYPIGSPVAAGDREYALAREVGFETAVTTRPGGLYASHRNGLNALPRVSLNGLFQVQRYVDVFAAPDLFSLLGK
jgi:peptidoglycan/xylan/chitin deacetylase (PgdA/CDA1 family)